MLKEPFRPVLFSTLGDVFFEPDSGGIWWLNTGTGELTRVAESLDHFQDRLATDIADEWFMPLLIAQLHAAGKVPEPGECYTYVTLPVFAEGRLRRRQSEPRARGRTLCNHRPHPARDRGTAGRGQGQAAHRAVEVEDGK